MSRFILHRVGEMFNSHIDFSPQPIPNKQGFSGGHINVSNVYMRNEFYKMSIEKEHNLDQVITSAIGDLKKNHSAHIELFGIGNEKRLNGTHETSKYHQFDSGVGSRLCSVRIPTIPIYKEGTNSYHRQLAGYIEDRRPSANMDPYIVCTLIAQSIYDVDNDSLTCGLIAHYK
jgi:glutamine synthetase